MNERKKVAAVKERKLHISKTVQWLNENCTPCPDVCLPREILYAQYTDFCKKQNTRPTCKATFGKVVRNTFPEVTSKRLGARGQSKYHYSGIGIKSGGDFTTKSSNEGVTRFSKTSIEKKREIGTKAFTLNSKIGTLMPRFPGVDDLCVPSSMDQRKLKIFLNMYRIHCQCIVDVTVGENFEEIRLFLLHFWQGFPHHLLSILEYKVTIDVLMVCDSILHRTLTDVLIPSEIIEIPEKLLRGIQNVASHWQKWLMGALEYMPHTLKTMKMEAAKIFCGALKRHAALLHFSQVARPILSQIPLKSLHSEILNLECDKRIRFIKSAAKCNSANKVECDVMNLLENAIDIEHLMECLDVSVSSIYQENEGAEADKQFLLLWVYSLGRLSHYLSENQSDNFITFHFWSTFIQEYLMLAIETRRTLVKQNLIDSNLKKHFKAKEKYSFDSFKSPTSCFMVNSKKCYEYDKGKHSNSTSTVISDASEEKTAGIKEHQSIGYSHKGNQQTNPCRDFNAYAPLETGIRGHWNEYSLFFPSQTMIL